MTQREGYKALSFQEPFATLIATGAKTVECRSRKINTPVKDLVVCSSKTPNMFAPIPGLTYGYAIGLVDIVECVPFTRKHLDPAFMSFMPSGTDNAWVLENARLIKPFPVKATASFYYVQEKPEVIPCTPDAYRKFVLPYALKPNADERDFVDALIDAIFNDTEALYDVFDL